VAFIEAETETSLAVIHITHKCLQSHES